MSMTCSETAGGLQTLPPRSSPQLAAAFHPARSDDEKLSFGPFRLLPARRLLLERDKPVRIGSRALDILSVLVERPGELVSKSELMAKVWPNTFVEEGNLKVHIAALRRALGDGQAGNRYISAVPGRGYCFVAPVDRSVDLRPPMAQHSATELSTNVPEPLNRLIDIDDTISRVSALLDQVIALVAESLVAADGNGSDCLRLLATTRAYALERLAQSGEGDAISGRQAQIMPTLAEADA
jgi:DNA-binding winged helix-turn-helix (wHTH) protein